MDFYTVEKSGEPVGLPDLKTHLSIDATDIESDVLLQMNLDTAIDYVEKKSAVDLYTTIYTCYFSGFTGDKLKLPATPFVSLNSVTVDNVTISDSTVKKRFTHSIVTLPSSVSDADVVLTYTTGGQQVAKSLKAAILMYAAFLFDTDSSGAVTSSVKLTKTIDRLISLNSTPEIW